MGEISLGRWGDVGIAPYEIPPALRATDRGIIPPSAPYGAATSLFKGGLKTPPPFGHLRWGLPWAAGRCGHRPLRIPLPCRASLTEPSPLSLRDISPRGGESPFSRGTRDSSALRAPPLGEEALLLNTGHIECLCQLVGLCHGAFCRAGVGAAAAVHA